MKKKSLLLASLLALSTGAFAGDYLTNTNQSIYFLRNPARMASIGIDGVYFNPAGVSFLDEGFHLQFNWQNAHQHRDAYANYGGLYKYNYANQPEDDGGRKFKGNVDVPIQPSLFAAYNTGDWSFQFGFGFIGGGGGCKFDDGVGSFEYLIGSTGKSTLGDYFGGYSLDMNVEGKSYDMGFTLAAAHKFSDNFALSLGVRGIYVTNSYTGSITNIKYKMVTPLEENIIDQNANPALSDLVLDCDQTGFGVAPIVGLDWKAAEWVNIGARFEFKTKLTVESKAHNNDAFNALAGSNPSFAAYTEGAKTDCDMPAMASAGAQFIPAAGLRVNVGYNHYFDMDTRQWTKSMVHNTNEICAGVEYDINDMFEVGAGFQKTMFDQTDLNISDMSFNMSSYSYGLGVGVKVSPKIKLNVAYFQTIYDDWNKSLGNNAYTEYSRTNFVIGAGIDINF